MKTHAPRYPPLLVRPVLPLAGFELRCDCLRVVRRECAHADPPAVRAGAVVAAGVRAGLAGGKKADGKKPGSGLVIPKPINLPSRRKENNGFDPSISLVPAGASSSWMSSGARPGMAVPAGMPVGAPGAYPGQARPAVGPQAVGAPRLGGAPGGWGASSASNAVAASGVRAAGGDFPELGGPARPANPWKAPASAPPADDARSRTGGASRTADGRGNGRDWAEDDEEEPMDFRRPVVIEKESGGAGGSSASANAASGAPPSSAPVVSQSDAASAGPTRVDPREEARMLALRKQVRSCVRSMVCLLATCSACLLSRGRVLRRARTSGAGRVGENARVLARAAAQARKGSSRAATAARARGARPAPQGKRRAALGAGRSTATCHGASRGAQAQRARAPAVRRAGAQLAGRPTSTSGRATADAAAAAATTTTTASSTTAAARRARPGAKPAVDARSHHAAGFRGGQATAPAGGGARAPA